MASVSHPHYPAVAHVLPPDGHRLYGNLATRIKWRLQAGVAAARTDGRSAGKAGMAGMTGGALPHLHEEQMDRGECTNVQNAPQAADLYWPGDVVLTHWGLTDCWLADVHHVVVPPGTAGSKGLAVRRSAEEWRWRVHDQRLVRAARLAYPDEQGQLHPRLQPRMLHPTLHDPPAGAATTRSDAFSSPAHSMDAKARLPPPARRRSLFFQGSTRFRSDQEECYHPRTPTGRCRTIYSMGARQTVQRLLGNDTTGLIRFNRGRLSAKGYHARLRTYEWCLEAPGFGFGVRIVDYIVSGCIPVIIRPGGLRLPFEPELDYARFAVDVPFEQIPGLPALLASMSTDEIRRKRARLREVHRLFLWDEEVGQAYEATMEAVEGALRRSLSGEPPL